MQITPGKLYFLHGRHVAFTGLSTVVGHILHHEVRTVEDFNEKPAYLYTTSMTPLSEVQEICSDLFPIGTMVRSTLGNNVENALVGKVTGYEYKTNRVIVVSSKIAKYSDQRCRYSYGINELVPYTEPKLSFDIIGGIYLINMKDTVMAVDELFHPGYVSLVYTEGQQSSKRMVPMNGTLEQYIKLGIHTIEYLEG
ncbi:hypothetical protein D3C75_158880 [compost metagenome]